MENKHAAFAYELPPAGLLSNGTYHVLVAADGGGHSSYDGRLLSPMLGPGTCLYVADSAGGSLWSLGMMPVSVPSESYEATVGPGTFLMRRIHDGIRVTADICVVPDADAELRRYTVANRTDRRRRLSLTAVTELAPAPRSKSAGADRSYATSAAEVCKRAGSNGSGNDDGQTVTEYVDRVNGILATLGGSAAAPLYWLHAFVAPPDAPSAFETDGSAFFGPDHAVSQPPGIEKGLTGTVGKMHAPILGLQVVVTLDGGEQRSFVLAGCAGSTRDSVIETAAALSNPDKLADAFLEAALREQQARDRLKLGPRNADRYHRVAAAVERGEEVLRAVGLDVGEGARDAVQKLNLESDRPLVVCRIADETELHVARLALKASAFWHTLGLDVQVLFLNDKSGPHANELQRALHGLIEQSQAAGRGAVLRHADAVSPDDQRTVQQAARLVLTSDHVDLLRVRS